MAKNPRPKLVAPIYAFAFTWFFFALIGIAINDLTDVFVMIFFAFGAAAIAYCISAFVRWLRRNSYKTAEAPPPAPPIATTPKTGHREVDAFVKEGLALIAELEAAKSGIQNRTVVRRTNEVVEISQKIIEKLQRQPEVLPAAKRFFNYYLPTTNKLVINYGYLENQGITGGHIANTMKKIESSLYKLTGAYESQLDSLFSRTALDLETDIEVLENILQKEGLLQNELQSGNWQAKGQEEADQE